ncbi:MAG: rhodanese-like domain-containing protein [Actinomycetota bacterium]|nr:rhodanese-like domain-containing protein [Actinomycetota bacterium]
MTAFRRTPIAHHRTLVASGAQLVDVREPDEVADGMLAGAVNIPLGELPLSIGRLDRTRTVALVCRSGNRSATAAQMLVEAGFRDVVNLEGGMSAL